MLSIPQLMGANGDINANGNGRFTMMPLTLYGRRRRLLQSGSVTKSICLI